MKVNTAELLLVSDGLINSVIKNILLFRGVNRFQCLAVYRADSSQIPDVLHKKFFIIYLTCFPPSTSKSAMIFFVC